MAVTSNVRGYRRRQPGRRAVRPTALAAGPASRAWRRMVWMSAGLALQSCPAEGYDPVQLPQQTRPQLPHHL